MMDTIVNQGFTISRPALHSPYAVCCPLAIFPLWPVPLFRPSIIPLFDVPSCLLTTGGASSCVMLTRLI
jgi:hypothetical protein